MFVILTYDVAAKRVAKVSRIAKKYLNPRLESVFDGYVTEKQLNNLKRELSVFLKPDYDSVLIYKTPSVGAPTIDKMGVTNEISSDMIL